MQCIFFKLSLFFSIALTFALTGGGGATTTGEEWCYGGRKACGPRRWKGKCRFGAAQSPINIVPLNVKRVTSGGRLVLSNNYRAVNTFNVVNNGHTVQFELNASPKPTLTVKGTGWKGVYGFAQMHFHWGSEHLYRGKRYPLELHLVHQQTNGKGGIGVLGVIFALSNQDNAALTPIIDSLSSVVIVSDSPIEIEAGINLTQILPPVWDVFRYKGSLTTPPCSEQIMWSVFTQRVPISKKQLAAFKKLRDSKGKLIKTNARPIQPTFSTQRRAIYWLPVYQGRRRG